MTQVTYLRCGGVILCTAINHCLCDGIGTSQFLHAWAHADTTSAPIPIQPQAFISIWGEGAEEKALELNGSDMGGFKLVVVSCEQPVENCPRPVDDAFPPRFANPKKTSRYKMKKKKANRKKAWK
ncbi:unnamed protein product [Brassica oleracea var. botrytis]|uniref:Uncharacterized protein n=1 Tax=Brassica oleracea TaxID=3712 RepID=A0A3P6F8N1_BRAOL|nr:unnamed protein product [Brassica oleracea]